MTFLDLFAGIGGFRLGMEMVGHTCVGHCEIDKFAQKSYRAMHRPKEGEWYAEDITKVRADGIPVADCWCFGFPCQDISIAGWQGGFSKGKRSSLFFTVTGLIKDLEEKDRPKLLFIENVKNLLSINKGFDFLHLLIELDEIGYDAEWQVLNSKDFGIPQNRERVFIVGHLRGGCTRQVFPVGGKNTTTPIKQIGNCMPTKTRKNPNQGRIYAPSEISPCLNKMEGGGRQPKILQIPRGKNKGDIKDYCPTITKNAWQQNNFVVPVITPDRVHKRQNGRRFKSDNEPMFTLTAQDRHGVMIYDADRNRNAHCLDANYYKGLCANQARTGVYDGYRIRRLTPRECFRLQGFPDNYFDRAAKVNSDTQLYKQAGNSVTVNVIYAIGQRLEIVKGARI
jgi:DNA (cytosine-5)-methyltransferase 1